MISGIYLVNDRDVHNLVDAIISEEDLSPDLIEPINQLHPADIGDLLESCSY